MKITAKKAPLLTAISRIQGIVEKSSIMPITANALIKADNTGVSISATNLEIGIIATYNDFFIEKIGSVSINARKLFEIIKELPDDEITIFEKEDQIIYIICGKIKYTIKGLPPEDFPMFFQKDVESYITWEREKIKEMVDYTFFSISHDEKRSNICGAFIEMIGSEKIRMVTTDGYRLSFVDRVLIRDVALEEGILIPQKGISELRKILHEKDNVSTIALSIVKNNLSIKVDEIELLIRLIDKKFPEYQHIIPNKEEIGFVVEIEKESIKSALRRMSIIAHEKRRPVKFEFKENIIDLYTEDDEFGSGRETVETGKKVNKDFSICINGSYLLDIINTVNDDIFMEVNKEKDKPIIVRPVSKQDVNYIIMPMISD